MYTRAILAVLGLSVLCVVSSAAAQGSIYKWVDAQGRIHYSDTPIDHAESVDDALPPAANFATPAEPESPATTATEPPSEPPLSPTATAPAPSSEPFPSADVPLSADEDGPEPSEFLEDEESSVGGVEPTERGAVGPAADEEEDPSLFPAQASAESFNFTEFDDFIPGSLEGEEALDDESLAAEGIEEDEFE